ncbi:MAG: hypothetical protein ABIO39_01740 [Caulobacteraceae bacterium]
MKRVSRTLLICLASALGLGATGAQAASSKAAACDRACLTGIADR